MPNSKDTATLKRPRDHDDFHSVKSSPSFVDAPDKRTLFTKENAAATKKARAKSQVQALLATGRGVKDVVEIPSAPNAGSAASSVEPVQTRPLKKPSPERKPPSVKEAHVISKSPEAKRRKRDSGPGSGKKGGQEGSSLAHQD
ncbi:unnamed protein product [Amoebophrya sp. A120]|nr:unnamed protein product [Amoebophrya sp. A120]|eukprot:GSA120T00021429001.1